MNTLLIIIAILVVLFFMQQRECFAIECDTCATRLAKSNCMEIPSNFKVNGGCPQKEAAKLSADLAKETRLRNICSMVGAPCIDTEKATKSQKELSESYKKFETARNNYNTKRTELAGIFVKFNEKTNQLNNKNLTTQQQKTIQAEIDKLTKDIEAKGKEMTTELKKAMTERTKLEELAKKIQAGQ
jgi:hypothetical protein